MKTLLQRAQALNPEIVAHRRRFHQYPELGLDLPLTADYVCKALEDLGYTPRRLGRSSIVAEVGEGEGVFLLRADMDALPIQEATGLPFASATGGRMHACGHDCHAAMLLGAARLLRERADGLKGRVRLLFQAGEEILDGAREAVEAGVLENPKVDGAMMIHIMSGLPIPEGTVCFPAAGGCYASADWYRVDVRGKGGHGAMPERTVSAVNTLCAINAGIQEICAVMTPPSANACITVGELHAGDPGGGNVIPATAYLAGTIRTYDEGVRATVKDALERLCHGAAQARGAQAQATYSHSTPVALQDAAMRRLSMELMEGLLGAQAVLDLNAVFGGAYGRIAASEDFAYIAQKAPSAILLLAAGTPQRGYRAPSHNPATDFDEDVLYVGAAAYAAVAQGFLSRRAAQ